MKQETVEKLLRCQEFVDISINGQHFKVSKVIIEDEFVTSQVEGFEDIHAYIVGGYGTDPKQIFDEVMSYISFDEQYYDMDIEKFNDIKISPDTSEFIDKYLIKRYKLLLWICNHYGNDSKNNILELFYVAMFESYPDANVKLFDVLEKEFPELWEKMMYVFGDELIEQPRIKRHGVYYVKLLRLLIRDEEMFVPRFVEKYVASIGKELLHTVPNIACEDIKHKKDNYIACKNSCGAKNKKMSIEDDESDED